MPCCPVRIFPDRSFFKKNVHRKDAENAKEPDEKLDVEKKPIGPGMRTKAAAARAGVDVESPS
jgi:hypothetical protein